jgi:hypothetical protein
LEAAHLKMDKPKPRLKENTFTEFVPQLDEASKNHGPKVKNMNNLQANAYEPYFKPYLKSLGLQEDLPGNGMLMNIINKRKIMSTTHHRINQLSKPLKKNGISKVN